MLHQLIEFYNENKDKLTHGIISRSINYDNIDRWIDLQEDECSRMLALMIKKYIRCISFDEFESKLSKVANNIVDIIDKVQPKHVILYIPDLISKSNTWVTLLVLNILYKYVTHVICEPRDFTIVNTFNSDDTFMVITCDDMSYSGQQLSENILRTFKFIGHKKSRNMIYALCLPYATTQSLFIIDLVFNSRKNIDEYEIGQYINEDIYTDIKLHKFSITDPYGSYYIPNDIEIIYTLDQQLALDPEFQNYLQSNRLSLEDCIVSNTKYRDYFGRPARPNKPVVVFDHKIADFLSTYPDIFINGCYYNNHNTKCTDQIFNKHKLPLVVINEHTAGYGSYYNIEYTFEGQPIDRYSNMCDIFEDDEDDEY